MPDVVARRLGLGFVLALVLSVAAAAPAGACTQEEYLTEEQRQSGQYDSRPSEWETQWGGGGPHTHGDASAPAAQSAPDPAPAEIAPGDAGNTERAPAAETNDETTPARKRSLEGRPAPAAADPRRKRDVAPAPAIPVTPEQTAVAAVTSDARPAPPAEASAPTSVRAARAAASSRPRTSPRQRQGGKSLRAVPTGRRLGAAAAERTAPIAAPTPAGGDGSVLPLPALLAAVALLAAGAALVRRRRPPSLPAVVPPSAPLDPRDAAIEAELQEIVAEERARRELGQPVSPRR